MPKNKRMRLYPCKGCSLNCSTDCILCDVCKNWFHFACENLSAEDIKVLTEKKLDYICVICSSTKEGNFDFSDSLQRLDDAAKKGYKSLQMSCFLESILLRNTPVKKIQIQKNISIAVDQNALSLLQVYEKRSTDLPKLPLSVTADGNCLYNAISDALYGDEHSSKELRVRSCIEICLHPSLYSDNFPPILSEVSHYIADCLSAAHDGSFASARMILGVANMPELKIRSIYPPMNGLLDIPVSFLNTTFPPNLQNSVTIESPVIILWSRRGTAIKNNWAPNHFVPLINNFFFVKPERCLARSTRLFFGFASILSCRWRKFQLKKFTLACFRRIKCLQKMMMQYQTVRQKKSTRNHMFLILLTK